MVDFGDIGRILVVAVGSLLAVAAGLFLFVIFPERLVELVGIILALVVGLIGIRIASSVAQSIFPPYNVAEVAVEGPITRDGGGGMLPSSPQSVSADDIVEQVERAEADRGVDALLVKLNTPGGEIVPSDDIKRAVESFEGPTIAYTTDLCASGGYWIASGCDSLWAREASIVGSIGVRGSRIVAKELAEKVGLEYEGFTAGRYKDAGMPLKEMDDEERAYFQALVDDWYDVFVERVSEGRELDEEFVRETEAKIFLGQAALDLGLVDDIGTRSAVESALEEELGAAISVREFEPRRPIVQRVRAGALDLAYAFGAGISRLEDEGFRLRT